MEDKKYKRINYILNEKDLIENTNLSKIEINITELRSKINSIKKYEGINVLNTLSIVKSHINKAEAITTAQIEGLKINENEFNITLSQNAKLEDNFNSKLNLDKYLEPLNTINVLKTFDSIVNQYGLSSRSIKIMHKDLFKNVSSNSISSQLGSFKKANNILKDAISGEVIFIPAGIDILNIEMSEFENFINKDSESIKQSVINSGILHAWFERIHPFLDGNGRVGRTIIPFYLKDKKVIDYSIINLSYEFRKHQSEYYSKLNSIQITDSYYEWLDFYLKIFLVSIKKLNSFIDDIFNFTQDVSQKLLQNNKKFIRDNSYLIAKIFIKNKFISVHKFKEELIKSFEKNEIVKVPNDNTINAYLKSIASQLEMDEVMKKPLIYVLQSIPKIII